ncbi:MAG: hypothetical protein J6D79_04155 [Clostridia bacterium]|nr:hypothetical protein [Clostridia bacterium]
MAISFYDYFLIWCLFGVYCRKNRVITGKIRPHEGIKKQEKRFAVSPVSFYALFDVSESSKASAASSSAFMYFAM